MDGSRSAVLRQAAWPSLLLAGSWSALAFYFSTAGNSITLLAWVAPVPLLAFAYALAAAARQGAAVPAHAPLRLGLVAFLAAALGNLSWLVLYRDILPLAGLAALPLAAGLGFAATVLVSWFVSRRLGTLAGLLAFPCGWAAFELLLWRVSPHGTAGSLAYTQVDLLRLIQVASWTGLAGVTFVMLLCAAGLGAVLGDRPQKGIRWSVVVLPVAVLAAVLAAGEVRILRTPRAGRVTVGLVSVDAAMRAFDTTTHDEALAVLETYLESAGDLAVRGADAVVMPEKMVGVAPAYEAEVTSLLSSLSGKDEILVVAGLHKTGRDDRQNVAGVFANGRRVLEYEKQRLVPGLESGYRQGARPGVYRAPGGTIGVAICKDLDFAEVGSAYGRAGVGVLLVPAWDFGRDARVHARMALMRGVEGGYSVARAAANGLLTGSDYLGRVIAERPSDAAAQSMLLVELPLGRARTFYSQRGDWFAWSCVLAVAALAAAAAGKGGR